MAKVMLVEDDPTMLSLLDTLLEIEGFEVAQIFDFENVIEEVRMASPDVILMDVHIHDIDGKEILANLRADDGFGETKIIMSSGMDFRHECLAKGANDFILKPYMPDELINKIKQLI
jgi:DNA-binding response OmpR family regulator